MFVGGLDFETADNDLRSFFAQNGTDPIDVRMGRDDQGNCKGFAFVEFIDEGTA